MPVSRLLRTAVVVAALATVVTSCSEGSGDSGDGDSSAAIEIKHRYGTAELDGPAKRVVTLMPQWTDSAFALGVTPIGWQQEEDLYPWQEGEFEAYDGPKLGESGTNGMQLNYEQIAALEPDLIMAGYAASDKTVYNRLNDIAPTVGNLNDDDNVDSWEDITTTMGKVLGKSDEANDLVDKTTAVLDDMAATPGVTGTTYSFVNFYQSTLIAPVSGDGASTLFAAMGLQLAPGLKSADDGSGRLTLSMEQLDLLDGDVLMITSSDPADKAVLEADPRYQTLPAVAAGTAKWIDIPTITGLNTPSVLSIPYVVDVIRPLLEQAGASSG